MTTAHILDLLFAVLIVAALAATCRIAFLVAGQQPEATHEAHIEADDQLAA